MSEWDPDADPQMKMFRSWREVLESLNVGKTILDSELRVLSQIRGAADDQGRHDQSWRALGENLGRCVRRKALDGECQMGLKPLLSQLIDLTADADTTLRVLRGGSWVDAARNCRSAYRSRNWPNDRSHSVGFRVCLVRGPAASQKRKEQARS